MKIIPSNEIIFHNLPFANLSICYPIKQNYIATRLHFLNYFHRSLKLSDLRRFLFSPTFLTVLTHIFIAVASFFPRTTREEPGQPSCAASACRQSRFVPGNICIIKSRSLKNRTIIEIKLSVRKVRYLVVSVRVPGVCFWGGKVSRYTYHPSQ